MRKRGGGRIINMTTGGGKAPGQKSVPTSVSRAAGINLAKSMATEYAPENILVNTICLGLLKSMQHERRYEQQKQNRPDLTLDGWYDELGKRVPVGRVGEAEEVGDLVAFLSSNRAAFITGTSINIDGGACAVD
jgi:NAD(P)-dependent dehydrogenase (short-subunit alcohol dehydrogenase family)